MKVFLTFCGFFFIMAFVACHSSDDKYEEMCDVLQQAETVFQHRDDEPYNSNDTDTLQDPAQLKDAVALFVKRNDFLKAAKASLYCGYIQKESDDKASAMKSFKDAEYYSIMAGDSLIIARTRYNIALMLFGERDYSEAITVANTADSYLSDHYNERAWINNLISNVFITQREYNKAEPYLKKSLELAEKGGSKTAISKILNNYSVFYREQCKYKEAIDCLKRINSFDIDSIQMLMFNMNMGIVYLYDNIYDSAAFYTQKAAEIAGLIDTKPETIVTIYYYLSYIAEKQGLYQESLSYHKKYANTQYKIQKEQEKKNLYSIQRQYDYEALQNKMNQKIIQKQRVILTISFLLLFASIVAIGLLVRHKIILNEDEKIREELDKTKHELQKSVKSEVIADELSRQLHLIIIANRISKRADDYKKEWSPLVYKINNEKDNMFEAAVKAIERVYPGMRHTVLNKYPNLNETESKVLILSCSDLTNAEIGEILGLTVHSINKSKSELRKKIDF